MKVELLRLLGALGVAGATACASQGYATRDLDVWDEPAAPAPAASPEGPRSMRRALLLIGLDQGAFWSTAALGSARGGWAPGLRVALASSWLLAPPIVHWVEGGWWQGLTSLAARLVLGGTLATLSADCNAFCAPVLGATAVTFGWAALGIDLALERTLPPPGPPDPLRFEPAEPAPPEL